MNILIVSSEPEWYGHKVLVNAIKRKWPQAAPTILLTLVTQRYQSFASTGQPLDAIKMENGPLPRSHLVAAKPADLIYLAYHRSEKFLPHGQFFDLVLCGVDLDAAVGLDAWSSSAIACAMLANLLAGACAFAFSQAVITFKSTDPVPLPDWNDAKHFATAERGMGYFLDSTPVQPGYCVSVNFPAGPALGWKSVKLAAYPSRRPYRPAGTVDYAKFEDDAQLLRKGFVTLTELHPTLNIPPRF